VLKAVLLLPLFILLAEAIILMPRGFDASYITLLGTLIFLLIVFWCVLPRRYAVMDDRLRIDLGWPFGFNLYYRNLVEIRRDSGGWYIRANFVTTMDPARALRIVTTGGMQIMITPTRRDPFADKLEIALATWRQRPAAR
jgi:hypothetical protein